MALMPQRAGITPFFKTIALENKRKSVDSGRPIYEDVEVCEIRFAGSKECYVFPSTQVSHWENDEETGEQRQLTYAERFPRQYQQFKAKMAQTKSGTPLDYIPFLTDAKRAELRALSIYTVEALAELDGQPLKNLGIGGRELKNKALAYLENANHDGVILRQQQQIDELLTRIKAMEAEAKLASNGQNEAPPPVTPGPDPVPTPEEEPDSDDSDDSDGVGRNELPPAAAAGEFSGMNRKQLMGFIAERTGAMPVGNPSMRTLVKMAEANSAR
jgi:hypothetical protein